VIKPEWLTSSSALITSSLYHLITCSHHVITTHVRNTLIALSVPQTDYPTEETVMARKYSKKASKKVEKAMHERKRGKLKSGGSGKKVTSRKQAIAIGLSEARRSGAKVPKKKAATRKKKSGGRKTGAKKKASKKK
jgi:hypothetical protein